MSAGRPLPGTPLPMHRWKGAGGLLIAGDSWGDPNGPLVLLQHGGGQTRHAWKNAGEHLGAAGYRAVAFDARGHGDSEWAKDGNYTQDSMVDDLLCIVEQLGEAKGVTLLRLIKSEADARKIRKVIHQVAAVGKQALEVWLRGPR